MRKFNQCVFFCDTILPKYPIYCQVNLSLLFEGIIAIKIVINSLKVILLGPLKSGVAYKVVKRVIMLLIPVLV